MTSTAFPKYEHMATNVARFQHQARDWHKEAENGDSVDYGTRIALLLNRVTDLLATCIAQQEGIHSLHHANQALTKRIQQLEQRPIATSSAGPSDLVDRVNVLEIDVGTLKTETQRLDQQVGAAATPSSAPRESIPKFEGLLIFCDASKTEPIPWWRQFELKLDIHHVIHTNRHAYLYSRSGGACQAWLDNMLSAHACTVSELHNFITWANLTAAWKKHFQVEPPEHQAMDNLLTFAQNSMPSKDWIYEFQRLASTPKLPLNFDGIKLYFIKRSCPALQNALTQVAENLNTSDELFNKAAQIIVTNLEAKNIGRSSTAGQGAYQNRLKVVVVAAATPSDPSTSNEAASSAEGDILAGAQNGGRPAKGRGRGKTKTNTSSGPGQATPAQEPWTQYGLPTLQIPQSSSVRRTATITGPLAPREAIAMDITGLFPKHKTGVDGILTVVDRLTKFAMFLPCRYHAKALELVEVLYAGWIRTKGYPKEIVCDRDTRFMSKFWLALIKRWGSSLKPSSARHPQTDGQTERAHQTAQVLLRTLIGPDQKDWVERLPDIELVYNSSIHPAIGMSPFEFEHGSPVDSSLDTIIPRTAESDDHLLFIRRMQELLVKARDQMSKTQQRMRQQANRQRIPCPFHAGDLIWVSAVEFSLEQDISRKLLPKWMGPWPVVARRHTDAPEGPSFIIQVPAHLPVNPVFYCSKWALYTPAELDDFPGRRSQDPPSMDGFQEVGDIISQRRYDNRPTEFLVHFAYCTHRVYRWLTRVELQATAPNVLARYERKLQGKPASSAPRRTRVLVPPSDCQLRPRPGLTS
ncbi:hypothetical protein CBR_g37788 [Chara braunii]|uniref:Integrase catalytic domain-containing protein n=1 Tax=Chara braunii TaxID=69332 RepID=A0A388LNL9_CHABU|nr:hypothetical protein CBR_g37788 [Chara braunii]|eukprot:GBG83917.1 hypothetical protein CBR_g37788 [Chara braunii]